MKQVPKKTNINWVEDMLLGLETMFSTEIKVNAQETSNTFQFTRPPILARSASFFEIRMKTHAA